MDLLKGKKLLKEKRKETKVSSVFVDKERERERETKQVCKKKKKKRSSGKNKINLHPPSPDTDTWKRNHCDENNRIMDGTAQVLFFSFQLPPMKAY